MWALSVLLVSIIGTVWSYPSGAPLDSCAHMFPVGHGKDAQTGSPIYKILLSSNSYKPGDTITVTLENATHEYFEGILIQARRAESGTNQNITIGTWSVNDTDLKTINCYGLNNSAVTQSVEKHYFRKVFTWHAPASPQGHLYFVTTQVRNKARFWVGVNSAVIRDESRNSTGSYKNPVTPPPVKSEASTHTIVSFALSFLSFSIVMMF